MCGCICSGATSKEEYLRNAEAFLDYFEENVLAKIADLDLNDDERGNGMALSYQKLIAESKQLDRDAFIDLVIENWDESQRNLEAA